VTGKAKKQGPIAEVVAKNVAELLQITKTPSVHLESDLYQAGNPIPALGIRRILSNNRSISIDEAAALAKCFGLSLEEITLPNVVHRYRIKILEWSANKAIKDQWPV
jgi:hypothetical protein